MQGQYGDTLRGLFGCVAGLLLPDVLIFGN